MEGGFIVVPNSLLDSDVWNKNEKYNKLDAFIYLAKEARWQNNSIKVKDILCSHNQLVRSYSELMIAWHLNNKNEVKRYLDYLQNGGWIDAKVFKNATLITILKKVSCNDNVTTNVTDNISDIHKVDDTFVTANVTQTLPQKHSSRAQVVLNLFPDSDNNNTNKEEKDIYAKFEQFRLKYKSYGGVVRGFQTELDAFKKKHKDWKEVIPMLEYCIDKENEARMKADAQKIFFARIQNLKTYLNQRSWERYSDGWDDYDPNGYHPSGLGYDADFDAYRFFPCNPNYDLDDGYTADNRPDGARIVEQINVYVWSKDQRLWIRQ